jgi:hypothetical protein
MESRSFEAVKTPSRGNAAEFKRAMVTYVSSRLQLFLAPDQSCSGLHAAKKEGWTRGPQRNRAAYKPATFSSVLSITLTISKLLMTSSPQCYAADLSQPTLHPCNPNLYCMHWGKK